MRDEMKLTESLDEAVMARELGARLSAHRIELDLTQAALAERAGVSKRTVERLETGEVATKLTSFLAVCAALDLLDRLEVAFPEQVVSPVAMLRLDRRRRKRVRRKLTGKHKEWEWGDEK
jgi:DNA-binding XRE family transcriptional regulator